MTVEPVTAESLGYSVLGPIVAEFSLRLWSLGSLMTSGQDTAFLFCARGGLRMQLAYELFLARAGLTSPTHVAPLMVSRVAAMRPALMRTVTEQRDTLVPSAAATLTSEFPGVSLTDVALAMAGTAPDGDGVSWDRPMTPDGFAALLRHPDGAPVVEALSSQSELFLRHLHEALGHRRRAVIVDTGLYGTTCRLLRDAVPDIDVSSALIALSFAPGGDKRPANVFGLSVESEGYSPLLPRTSLLRYWHFVEWLFEPELPSVRQFDVRNGCVHANLEVPGWQEKVQPTAGTAFSGVMDYLDGLPPGPAERVVKDARRAWVELRRAVVWPCREQGEALAVGLRSHDFGRDETWSARPWHGSVAALRGSAMWREGEIARSGTPWRRPLLIAVEAAYAARRIRRDINRRQGRS